MFNRRKIDVSVAVVFEPEWGFFLGYNRPWHGYNLPMRKRRMTDVDGGFGALAALRDATELPLRGATVAPLVALEVEGQSQRTGEATLYRYHAFDVKPHADLSTEVVPFGFGCRSGFLKPCHIAPQMPVASPSESISGQTESSSGEIVPPAADLVTWSTRRIVEELIGNQRVAVAAICRPGEDGPEFLMNRNANYRGYYPIAARCRSDAAPKLEVREAVRKDTGYLPWVDAGKPITAEHNHISPRFQCNRHFVYSVFPVNLPGVNLGERDKELAHCLERSGLLWRWVAAHELHDPLAHGLSPTITEIREALLQAAAECGCG